MPRSIWLQDVTALSHRGLSAPADEFVDGGYIIYALAYPVCCWQGAPIRARMKFGRYRHTKEPFGREFQQNLLDI